MISSRQKKLERKKRKRKEKIKKIKNTPLDVRGQHVGKSDEEKKEYFDFIRSDNYIRSTSDAVSKKDERDDIGDIEIIGDKKIKEIDRTDKTGKEKESYDTKDLQKIKKITKWQEFKNRWNRKWADNLIDLIFNSFAFILTTIVSLIIGYFFASGSLNDEIDKLRSDISNKDSEIRKAILEDVVDNINSSKSEETIGAYQEIMKELINNNSSNNILNSKIINNKSTSTTE